MNKELKILELEQQIQQLKKELCMLCDSDYYKQCDLIEQLELELKEVEDDNK